MSSEQQNNPLHGVSLEKLLNRLVNFYGWEKLGKKLDMDCFLFDPSIKSSLKFLRKTPWARAKVENFYLNYGNPPWRSEDFVD